MSPGLAQTYVYLIQQRSRLVIDAAEIGMLGTARVHLQYIEKHAGAVDVVEYPYQADQIAHALEAAQGAVLLHSQDAER